MQDDGVGEEKAPAIILPSPNTQTVRGDLVGVASTVPLVSPQPFVEPMQEDADALASRIEADLAEDGRFTAFQSAVEISIRDGVVRLTGKVPSAGQRNSFVAAVRSVPGVETIDDSLTVG